MLRTLCISLFATLSIGSVALADVVVGSFPSSGNGGSLRTFDNNANGNSAPIRTLGGSNTGLVSPTFPAFEAIGRDLFVADFTAQAIRVFAFDATGNVAPGRLITSPSLGQPRQIALNRAQNELYVIAFLNFVNTYPLDASGEVGALRTIQREGAAGSLTRLTNPSGLVYFPQRGELYVGDFAQPGGAGPANGEILIFPRTASGLGAPIRDITGAATRLGSFISDLALDASRNELYVLVSDDFGLPNRIVVHDAAGSGNVAPLREIAGAAALLEESRGIAFDPTTDRIWVTTGSQGGTPRVLAYPRTTNGNVAPAVVIAGAATGLERPFGVHVFQTNDVVLFANGFE